MRQYNPSNNNTNNSNNPSTVLRSPVLYLPIACMPSYLLQKAGVLPCSALIRIPRSKDPPPGDHHHYLCLMPTPTCAFSHGAIAHGHPDGCRAGGGEAAYKEDKVQRCHLCWG